MTARFFILWLCTISTTIMASACQNASEATSAPLDSAPFDETPSATLSVEEGPIEIELEGGPGDYFLPDPRMGLEGLSSYKETLVISFNGTLDGQTQQVSSTYLMLHTKEPLTRQLNITTTGDASVEGPSLIAETNGVTYEINEEGKCTVDTLDTAVDGEDSFLDWMQPNTLLLGVVGAEAAGQETMNDLETEYYIFDQQALIEAGVSEANGELWIASEGGLLIRYVLSLTGSEDYFGEGTEGVMTWDYEISDINQTPPPALPDSCRINVPLLTDAANIIDIPDWLAFDTAFSVQDASAFYQQELSALGWQIQPDQIVYDLIMVMEFAQNDQILIVSVSLQGDGTARVNIIRGEPEGFTDEQ